MIDKAPGDQDGRVEVLTSIYPLFKREVYLRRQSIMWLAGGGNVILLALLLAIVSGWLIPGKHRWAVALSVVVFSCLLVVQMHQQALRHKQAKHSLIDIEKALGFFDEGTFLPARSLYPQTWQQLPERDWQYSSSVLSLLVQTVLVVLTSLMP